MTTIGLGLILREKKNDEAHTYFKKKIDGAETFLEKKMIGQRQVLFSAKKMMG